MIVLLLIMAIIFFLVSCGLYEAVVGAVESGDEAAQAATEAAEQTTQTLKTVEQLLLMGGAYFLGEVRRPLWSKAKQRVSARLAKKKKPA